MVIFCEECGRKFVIEITGSMGEIMTFTCPTCGETIIVGDDE